MNNRAIHIWGATLAVLLALNCYFTYKSALIYEKVPMSHLTNEQNNKCLAGEAEGRGEYYCPQEWHLKGNGDD